MSSINGSTFSSIPVFDGNNFQTWQVSIQAYLMFQGLWSITANPTDYNQCPALLTISTAVGTTIT